MSGFGRRFGGMPQYYPLGIVEVNYAYGSIFDYYTNYKDGKLYFKKGIKHRTFNANEFDFFNFLEPKVEEFFVNKPEIKYIRNNNLQEKDTSEPSVRKFV